jgi:hypothetical protein
VRFSATEAHDLVELAAERNPELGVELRRRDGRVPVLRLPFPADGEPPLGYDTVAVLPLRDETSEELVRRLLAALDDALLLALPALTELVIDVDGQTRTLVAHRDADRETCTITEGQRTTVWRMASASGPLDLALLADRPVEERGRARWSVTWAVPVTETGEPQRPATVAVIHAPTPTDEPLGLPALLIASFPLDPTRRHVAEGPLTDHILEQAAAGYAGLVERWPVRTAALLRLVPGPIGEGPVDAELRRQIVARLAETAFLPGGPAAGARGADRPVEDPAEDPADTVAAVAAVAAAAADGPTNTLIRPRDAAVLIPTDEALTAALDGVLPGLLPAGFERDHTALATLGIRRLDIADLIEALVRLDRAPAWWHDLYTALDTVVGHDPAAREALSGLPVPLVDGRTVRGPRGTLRPVSGLDLEALSRLSPLRLRIVHPDALAGDGAADRLLERLGAQPAEPRTILADPAVADAIDAVYDTPALDDDSAGPAALAEAVLTLVAAAYPRPGEHFGLGGLLLPDTEGGFTAATDLLLASSALADVIEPDQYGRLDEDWASRWSSDVWHAVGVTNSFALLQDSEILLDPDTLDDTLLDLDGFEEWVEHVADLFDLDDDVAFPPVLAELTAVADLDLVRDERWPQALRLLAQPPLRAAVTKPARLLLADGRTAEIPSYTAWWLSTHPVLDGRCPGDLVDAEESSLAGLYDDLDAEDQGPDTRAFAAHDPAFLTALGVRSTARALLARPGGATELLDRLADPERPVSRSQLTDLYCTLADATEAFSPPDRLRATLDGRLVVADAEDVVVVDAPDLLPVLAGRPYLPIPLRHALALADLLDLDLASEAVGADADVVGAGTKLPVPESVRILLPDAADTYVEHDPLLLADGTETAWRVVDGVVHTSTFDGLARGLAWAAGRWDQRHLVAALLAEPERTAELLVEVDFE